MIYEAKQAVHIPVTDYLKLEFHLMDLALVSARTISCRNSSIAG